MRLIDADELIEMAYRMRLDSREQIACMIESAPTIEPEQKRGKWVIDNGCVCCSECGTPNREWNFCPNCGTKMDMEGE